MNLPHYNYLISYDFTDYKFISEGPKGKITKIVRFTKIEESPDVYNLGFGDEQYGSWEINDSITTNNDDRDLVLSTVANTVIDFTNYYGECNIVAKGSTASRTRLYQIGISGLLQEISIYFYVYGLKDDIWHDFQKNVNYEAFLIKRK